MLRCLLCDLQHETFILLWNVSMALLFLSHGAFRIDDFTFESIQREELFIGTCLIILEIHGMAHIGNCRLLWEFLHFSTPQLQWKRTERGSLRRRKIKTNRHWYCIKGTNYLSSLLCHNKISLHEPKEIHLHVHLSRKFAKLCFHIFLHPFVLNLCFLLARALVQPRREVKNINVSKHLRITSKNERN